MKPVEQWITDMFEKDPSRFSESVFSVKTIHCHGSITFTPAALNGVVSRVATA